MTRKLTSSRTKNHARVFRVLSSLSSDPRVIRFVAGRDEQVAGALCENASHLRGKMILPIARQSLPSVRFLIELSELSSEDVLEPARGDGGTDVARGNLQPEPFAKQPVELCDVVEDEIFVFQNDLVGAKPRSLDVNEPGQIAIEQVDEPFLLGGRLQKIARTFHAAMDIEGVRLFQAEVVGCDGVAQVA